MKKITTGIILNSGHEIDLSNEPLPSSLVEINGKTILERHVDQLITAGCSTIIIETLEHAETFDNFLSTHSFPKDINIYSSKGQQQLGSGGAIKNLMLNAQIDNALIVNGNSIIEFDLKDLAHAHSSSPHDITIAVTTVNTEKTNNPFTIIDNRLQAPNGEETVRNAYVYAINLELWNATHLQHFSMTQDFLSKNLNIGIGAHKVSQEIYFFSTPQEIANCEENLK